jgi:hypothetical protein
MSKCYCERGRAQGREREESKESRESRGVGRVEREERRERGDREREIPLLTSPVPFQIKAGRVS